MESAEEILTRDVSSGRIHRRYLGASGKAYTIEGDNLDEAGGYEVITVADFDASPDSAKCRNCFPDLHQQVG